jgi:hypothetical protein
MRPSWCQIVFGLSIASMMLRAEEPNSGESLPPTEEIFHFPLPVFPIRPERPDRPNRQRTEALKEMLSRFQQKRSEYIAKRRDLTRQLRGASDEDKSAVRENIRMSHASILEHKDEFHDELKLASEKLKELNRKLMEERRVARRRE